MRHVAICGLLALAALGCGSSSAALCSKAQDCAIKAGTSFSITDCQSNSTTNRELAVTKGCGGAFDELAACLSTLSCTDLTSDTAQQASCGGKNNTYVKCMQ